MQHTRRQSAPGMCSFARICRRELSWFVFTIINIIYIYTYSTLFQHSAFDGLYRFCGFNIENEQKLFFIMLCGFVSQLVGGSIFRIENYFKGTWCHIYLESAKQMWTAAHKLKLLQTSAAAVKWINAARWRESEKVQLLVRVMNEPRKTLMYWPRAFGALIDIVVFVYCV